MEIERKFDWDIMDSAKRKLRSLVLDEYELQIFLTTIERFCSNTRKNIIYNPSMFDGKLYFEVPIIIFQRKLVISIEVRGIDALIYKIEEI
jgi:hypothetical protein